MAVGLLESFELIQRYASKTINGKKILTSEEVLFSADAFNRKGCRMTKTTLTKEDIAKVLELGNKIKNRIGEFDK